MLLFKIVSAQRCLKLGHVARIISLIVKRKNHDFVLSKCQNIQIWAENPLHNLELNLQSPGCLMESKAFPTIHDMILYDLILFDLGTKIRLNP